jgi:hypothetical protein
MKTRWRRQLLLVRLRDEPGSEEASKQYRMKVPRLFFHVFELELTEFAVGIHLILIRGVYGVLLAV